MELGKRLRQARIEAGLSQRQLCGEEITRNMLSQIENGAARPSMSTLQYLATQLGKPVSYFLEEDAITSPNLHVLLNARSAYLAGQPAQALKLLESYRKPDDVFDPECDLLTFQALLGLAEQAIREQRLPYAASALEQAGAVQGCYIDAGLERRRLLLLHQACPADAAAIAAALGADDRELLLRACAAMEAGDAARCIRLLAACNCQDPQWNLLMGRAYMQLSEHSAATGYLRAAEAAFPQKTAPLLEVCYRELGDFRKAYEYARRQMENQG